LVTSSAARARDNAPSSAQLAQLATAPGFRKLLYYHPTLFGGLESQVDDPSFFLAARGATDPEAELSALVRAVRTPTSTKPNEDVRCRFPARVAWLAEQMPWPERGPANCPEQSAFLQRVEADSLSLVYASSSLDYPASALGHTFLLLRPRDASAEQGTSIDYRARADTKNPVLYAFKGLAGLFVGRFEILPEEKKMWNLLEEQKRDLWEFELALSPSELQLFLLHLWELSRAEIDYFYLTENCSYHALKALEAAAPRLSLVEQTKFVVLPIDTVHAVVHVPGLVKRTNYFPSKATRELDAGPGQPVPAPLEAAFPHPLRSPAHSHGPMRVNFGTGLSSEKGAFGSFGFRLTLHDLLDPPQGNPELMQIQLLSMTVRYSPLPSSFTVDEVTFVDLWALNTLDSPSPLAWRIRAIGNRVRDRSCPSGDCFVHGLDFGLGTTLATRSRALALFAMATSSVVFSDAISGIDGSFVRWTVGPQLGLRARLGPRSAALISGRWSYLPWQAVETTFDLTGQLRAGLSNDVALGLEGRVQPSAYEGSLSSFVYF